MEKCVPEGGCGRSEWLWQIFARPSTFSALRCLFVSLPTLILFPKLPLNLQGTPNYLGQDSRNRDRQLLHFTLRRYLRILHSS
jgi:hypothetical protein